MRLSFVQFSLLFLSFLFLSSDIYSESSSEYVEKIHADILKVVIAKQSIYEENPEEFINDMPNMYTWFPKH